jgi:uncharacterized membrane protein YecN with MAPEG domain
MDNMRGGKTDATGDRRGRRSGMGAMWLCLGLGALVLLSFFFWR